jgi:hypothetical protein
VSITVNNPAPTTSVVIPSNGATLSGGNYLDANASAGTTQVQFEISGNGLTNDVIDTAGQTGYGWIGAWDTTTVPNGTYTLQSVGTDSGGTVTSAPITITVSN